MFMLLICYIHVFSFPVPELLRPTPSQGTIENLNLKNTHVPAMNWRERSTETAGSSFEERPNMLKVNLQPRMVKEI